MSERTFAFAPPYFILELCHPLSRLKVCHRLHPRKQIKVIKFALLAATVVQGIRNGQLSVVRPANR
eukprot:763370-Hanusia_phi.AAC.4